jgi:YggT family protein
MRGGVLISRPQREKPLSFCPPALAAMTGSGYGRAPPCSGFHEPMRALFWLVDTLIDIYIWLLIAQAVLSWLLAFGVVNRYNRGVAVIGDFLYRVTEPALRPIRSFLPNFGGIDISPIILILILMFLRRLIIYDLAPSLL